MKAATIEWQVFARSDHGKLSTNSPTPLRFLPPSSFAPRVSRTSGTGARISASKSRGFIMARLSSEWSISILSREDRPIVGRSSVSLSHRDSVLVIAEK